jgi:processive 1,2-diacylglycerol beta-glucosyltransferase
MEKRILILTAGYGEGHNAAARGLRDGLATVSGGTAVVEMHDLFAETFGFVNNWIRKGYLTVINRAPRPWSRFYKWLDRQEEYGSHMRCLFAVKARLSQLLLRFQPTAVVSVFPAYPHLLETTFGGVRPPFWQVVCVTDSITVNAIWYRCQSDLFLVPNEQSAATLAEAGVPNEKVRVGGFPVSPKFVELGDLRQLPEARGGFRILYVINAGGRAPSEVIRGLTNIANVRLTVTVGRDERLRRAVEALRAEAVREFEIIGWTDQLPRLMLESHLLISKAGGATVQETIAAKCPMIINQVVPGQEEGNARLIVETRSGIVATTPEAIVVAVEQAFADDAQLWREWSANISRLSRPRASLEIAELLLAL